jgi:hypothetical protein
MEPMATQQETCQNKPERHFVKRIVGVVFGLIEVILAFRLVFSFQEANLTNSFVRFIFNITQFFVGLFSGIFSNVTISMIETKVVFEPETLIAIVVVALVSWSILELMSPR